MLKASASLRTKNLAHVHALWGAAAPEIPGLILRVSHPPDPRWGWGCRPPKPSFLTNKILGPYSWSQGRGEKPEIVDVRPLSNQTQAQEAQQWTPPASRLGVH